MSAHDVVVVGAGHNGLIAAAYLARAGHKVVVFERGDAPGGCAATEELWPGYLVDTGAHSLTALDSRVTSELDLAAAGLEVLSPDPVVVSPASDGRTLVLSRDVARTAADIRPFSERDAERWPEFVRAMSGAARTLEVLYRSLPPRLAQADRRDLWEVVRLGGRLGRVGRREALELMRLIPMTVEELLDEWFESDPLRGVLAVDGIRGICQGPMASGTACMFLHHQVGSGGIVRRRSQVRGGMGALGEALARIATGLGAEIRLEEPVTSIQVEDGRAIGIGLASGDRVAADMVVSNADPGRTLLGLVDPAELDPEFIRALSNIKYRGVCAKVHLALTEPPRFGGEESVAQNAVLTGASITIAPSIAYLERAYDPAKYGRPAEHPMIDAVLTTALDPGLAPAGRHVLSALVQYAPFDLRDGSWDDAHRVALGDAVVRTLAAHAPNLEGAIEHRHVLAPTDLADRFALTGGNIYHGEMTLDQVFIGRPVPGWARYRTPIDGLYLCGAGTHPGGGLNGRPGRAAAHAVIAATRRNRR